MRPSGFPRPQQGPTGRPGLWPDRQARGSRWDAAGAAMGRPHRNRTIARTGTIPHRDRDPAPGQDSKTQKGRGPGASRLSSRLLQASAGVPRAGPPCGPTPRLAGDAGTRLGPPWAAHIGTERQLGPERARTGTGVEASKRARPGRVPLARTASPGLGRGPTGRPGLWPGRQARGRRWDADSFVGGPAPRISLVCTSVHAGQHPLRQLGFLRCDGRSCPWLRAASMGRQHRNMFAPMRF